MKYFTTKQAADFLKVSTRTLANWREAGNGPEYSRIGGKLLYSEKDLVAFVESKKVSRESND